MKIQYLFLTHLHGDHYFGLPGLIATMGMHKRDYPLFIFGPKGTKEMVKRMKAFGLEIPFDINVKEIKEGVIFEEKEFLIKAIKAKHSVECFGHVIKEKIPLGKFNKQKALILGIPEGPLFRELKEGKTIEIKGKKIKPDQVLEEIKRKPKSLAYVTDTLTIKSIEEKLQGTQYLIHEATFEATMEERAKETLHSTAKQAAELAEKLNVEKLILTHFSPRHKDLSKIENEARQEFGKVIIAKDLMEIEL